MKAAGPAPRPRIAVVVATYEEPRRLELVLEGIARQSRPPDALAIADAELYLFLDGDSIPHRHWGADHAAAHGRAAVRCGRRVKLGPRITPTIAVDAVRRGDLEHLFGPVWRSALAGDTRRFGLGGCWA